MLAYIGEILVLGLSAVILIISLWLIAIIGFYLFDSITSNVAISIIVIAVICFISLKIYLRGSNHQKLLKERIARRETLGYDTSDLKIKLKQLESEESTSTHHDPLAKEKERRSSGYDN